MTDWEKAVIGISITLGAVAVYTWFNKEYLL